MKTPAFFRHENLHRSAEAAERISSKPAPDAGSEFHLLNQNFYSFVETYRNFSFNSLLKNSFNLKPVGLRLALVALLLGSTGCSNSEKNDVFVERQRSNTVVIGMPWEPRTLNPYRGVDSASYFSQTLIHGGLVRYNEKGDILPSLAESFQISSDGKTYTFNLRKNLKFSDGSDLTTNDVLASIKATVGPGSPFRSNYESIVSFESPSPLQIVLHLSAKNLPLMIRIADLRIVPASTFSEAMKNSNKLARAPVGCGPFLIHRWDPGFELVFRANSYYWAGKPKSEYLVWRVIPDGNLLSAALFRGDVDVARVDGRIELGVLSEHSDVEFRKFPGARTIFLAFNTEKAPYDNPTFRQAISMFIDKYSIVNNLYAGFAVVPACDFPECGPVYNRLVRRWPYDVKEAQRYLTASGFEQKSDGWFAKNPPKQDDKPGPHGKQQRLSFKIVTIKDFMDVAQVVAGDLQTAKIGVRVELVEYSTMKDKYLTTGDYDAVLFSRTQGPDPDCRLVWGKKGPLNYAHYKDDELDNLVEKAYRDSNEREREEDYYKIQALLGEKLPWVYLVQPSLTIAHKTYIKGIGEGVATDAGMPWDNPLFDAAGWSREREKD
jgi:peptide/nickel transport system substrate-binding protein